MANAWPAACPPNPRCSVIYPEWMYMGLHLVENLKVAGSGAGNSDRPWLSATAFHMPGGMYADRRQNRRWLAATPAIWCYRHRRDLQLHAAVQHRQQRLQLRGRHVPHGQCAVVCAAEESCAIRAEGHAADRGCMPAQHRQLPAGGCVPEPDLHSIKPGVRAEGKSQLGSWVWH